MTVFGKKAYKPRKYFNSHAHVERDDTEDNGLSFENISTHTLTWSVTRTLFVETEQIIISTHTLTWSVTDKHPIIKKPPQFQLTRSRGA